MATVASAEDAGEKIMEKKEQNAVENTVDALGVTVIPFGGRDDDSPSDE